MYKCDSCQQMFDKADLVLSRGNDGRWSLKCRNCASPTGQTANVPATDMEIPQTTDKTTNNESSIIHETEAAVALSGQNLEIPPFSPAQQTPERLEREMEVIFSHISKLLERLHKGGESGESLTTRTDASFFRGFERQYDRADVDLEVRYRHQRDDIWNLARMRDVSRGGMRFLTARQLSPGQVLMVELVGASRDDLRGLIKGSLEIKRVRMLAEGVYEAGGRFVRGLMTRGSNRRTHKRVTVKLTAFYRRFASEITSRGEVRDLSAGGMQLLVDEPMERGESFAFYLSSVQEGGSTGAIQGTVSVMRSYRRDDGIWCIGCQFMRAKK